MNNNNTHTSCLLEALINTGAMIAPVSVSRVASEANRLARKAGLPPMMEASWQRYLRNGHRSSVVPVLAKNRLLVLNGNGVVKTPKGEQVVRHGMVCICRVRPRRRG